MNDQAYWIKQEPSQISILYYTSFLEYVYVICEKKIRMNENGLAFALPNPRGEGFLLTWLDLFLIQAIV